MGAFVFAAQIVNFPVAIGTSAHLVGAALLAIVLGPAPAIVTMTAILAVQAFVFQDGGVLVLGVNVFNMAIVGVLAGYLPYHLWGAVHRRTAIFAAGALSVLAAATLALLELLVSGVPMPAKVLWAAIGVFAVSAVAEGAITVAVVRGIERLTPSAIREKGGAHGRLSLAILGVSALLATFGVALASARPDSIQTIANSTGIANSARKIFETLFTDYQTRFPGAPWLQKASAGIAGLILVYAVCLTLARMFSRRRSA
jgi:cobalt/nickel transport system permease protein